MADSTVKHQGGTAGMAPSDFESILADRLRELQQQLTADFRRVAAMDGHHAQEAVPRCSVASEGGRGAPDTFASPDKASVDPQSQDKASEEPETSGILSRRGTMASARDTFFPAEGCPVNGENVGLGRSATREFFKQDQGLSDAGLSLGDRFPSKSTGSWHSASSRESAREPSKYVLHPTSKFRLAFELTSLFVLSYDAVMTPWIVAWAPTWFGYTVISTVVWAFWVLDMIMNFFSGYHSEGEVVMSHSKIALHYIKTWFFLDLAINIADSASLAVELTTDTDGNGALAVVPAVLRVLRLFKASKIIPAVSVLRMQRKALSAKLEFIGLGAKLVMTLLWLNHLICCLWFFVGTQGFSDTGFSWLDIETPSGTLYRDMSDIYQYATSLHWSLTQMTPGSSPLTPQNTLERFFNICCLIIGLFIGALLVSQLSARMVETQLETREQSARLAKLRAYLREHQVSWELRDRVQGQILDRLDFDSRLTAKDVDLLSHLSTSLKRELNFECFGPFLMSHTLFHTWGVVERKLLEAVCLDSVELVCLSKDDDLFTPHTVPEKVYLVLKGTLQYRADGSESGYDQHEIGEGAWVSEAALWLEYSYSGTLTSMTKCELLSIDVQGVLCLLKKFPRVMAMNFHYCAAFHKVFIASCMGRTKDISISGEQLLMTMPRQWRMEVMLPLLHNARTNSFMNVIARQARGEVMDELREELSAGKAILSLINGVVTRTVLLVTLQLEREDDGHILVRLAKRGDNGVFEAGAALPGTKIKQEEDAQEAVQRMIHTDLFLHPDQLNMHHTVTSSETAVSPKYNINSKYLMSTVFATVNLDCVTHEFEWHTPTCLATPSLVRKIASCPPEERSAFEDLANCRGLLLRGEDGKVALYAWLSKAMFAGFKTPKGQEVLRSWVAVNAHSFPLVGVGSFTL